MIQRRASNGIEPKRIRLTVSEAAVAIPILLLVFFLCFGGLARLGFIMSAVWGLVYLMAAIWFAFTVPRSFRTIAQFWPVLLLPGVALLSTLWSLAPAETAAKAVQFLFTTILAIRIANVLSPRITLICLFTAAALGTLVSVLALVALPVPVAFEPNGAFRGIFTQKTRTGIALALFAFGAVSLAAIWRRPFLGLVCVIAVLPLIMMTKSISALVMLGGLGLITGFTLFRHHSPISRLGTTAFVATVSGLVISAIYASGVDLVGTALAFAGKSPTLTGRTDIWAVGWEIVDRFPILGVGFSGFWGNPDFSADWGFLHATVDPRLRGFHNTYIEVLTTTGLLGLAVAVAIYYWTFWRSFRWFLATGSPEALFWFAATLVALALSFTDNVLYSGHELFHFYLTLVFVHWGMLNVRPVFHLTVKV